MLDDGAVGDVLVSGLSRLGALGFDCCGANEGFQDGLLDTILASEPQQCVFGV